jgi:hypothetical protein
MLWNRRPSGLAKKVIMKGHRIRVGRFQMLDFSQKHDQAIFTAQGSGASSGLVTLTLSEMIDVRTRSPRVKKRNKPARI